MKRVSENFKKILVFIAIFLLWWAVSRSGIWSEYVLPGPGKVFSALIKMSANGELWRHLAVSLRRVVIGFAISCGLTFVLTFIAALWPKVVPYYTYLLGAIRHIPPISLIPLFILWFGIGELPKIIVIVLASVFPVLLNTENGIFGDSGKLTEVGRTIGFTKRQIFFRIMLPNAMPEILVGVRLGLGYAWRAIVGAEMIAAASGLGYLILDAQTLSRTDKVIAGVLVIGLCGLITDRLCLALERAAKRRRAVA